MDRKLYIAHGHGFTYSDILVKYVCIYYNRLFEDKLGLPVVEGD